MTKRLKLNYDIDTRKIYELVKEGYQLTCPRCDADLKVALTYEQARAKGMHGGIVCPNDPNHYQTLFEFAEPHRRMRKRFAEMQAEWEKEQAEKEQAKLR